MLNVQSRQIGALHCHVLTGEEAVAPTRALVLCHGFGAPGTDLVPLAEELCHLEPGLAEGTLFVFPEAPLRPMEMSGFGGRAWWPLDLLQRHAAIQAGQSRDLRLESPERLPKARNELMSVLAELGSQEQLPLDRIVIGGFSQGSMLATDVALHLPTPPAGLVIYSGTLLNDAEWSALVSQRAGLQVLQSHGQDDPILPFEGAIWLRDLLTSAKLDVEFQSFRGGHTITGEALVSTARLLGAVGR